jgi:hypothetical protein
VTWDALPCTGADLRMRSRRFSSLASVSRADVHAMCTGGPAPRTVAVLSRRSAERLDLLFRTVWTVCPEKRGP